MKVSIVYHHTSTRNLPFIVEAGELNSSAVGPDKWFGKVFIWGSTVPDGDPSAAIHRPAHGPHREMGYVLMVRFAFPASRFTPWAEIKRKYMKTKKDREFVREWQKLDEQIGVDVNTWWLRIKPLPIAAALAVEVKGYGRRDRWRPIDMSPSNLVYGYESCEGNGWDHPGCDGDEGPTTKGFIIGNRVYGATLLKNGASGLYDRKAFWSTEPLPGGEIWEPFCDYGGMSIKSRKPEHEGIYL